ncbi:GGDEF domain-containing protein [Kineococcus arenarius]|uniref:GGDEF domain-containing protein n=1 Tax=Kineococcus sp. SYSU DK007 TaxID=3383128 RepID=UPI003D7CF0AD
MSAPHPRPRPYRSGDPSGAPGRRWWVLPVGVPALGVLGVLLGGLVPARGPALAVAALAAAAALSVLARALVVAARGRRDVEDALGRVRAELGAARDESVKDEATDLLNRRGLELLGHQVLESARRSGGAVHACVVEVAPGVVLGSVSQRAEDLRGQREADWRAVAAALRSATRSSDVLARQEEGRFLVLGPGAGLHAQELERRVRVGLAQQRLGAGAGAGAEAPPRLAVEVGAAVLAPWDDGGVGELLLRAEQSLAQRRALRRSVPQGGWGRRRSDHRTSDSTERPGG